MRSMRLQNLSLLLLAAGCGPKMLGGLPDGAAEDATTIVGTSGATGTDAATLADTTATGAGVSDTASSGATTAAPLLHPSCEAPFPEPAPMLPPVNQGPDAHPHFDDWTKIACADVPADKTCGAPGDPPCNGLCVRGVPDGSGVCTFGDADIWCDGEGEALSYAEGACWVCSPLELHALACCAQLPGFDCRTWPFPADGPPGSVCARHEDCEPGLVCGAHRGAGYGICQCAGLEPDTVAPPDFCFTND